MIPARNVTDIKKRKEWEINILWQTEQLLKKYRAGEITSEDMTPLQRHRVQEFMMREYLIRHNL